METRSKASGGSEPLKKAIGAAKRQSGHQKVSNFSACKPQGNQHEIKIVLRMRLLPQQRVIRLSNLI